MQCERSVKLAKYVLYCLEGVACIIHLVIPVVILVLFLSLYHGMWIQ